MDREKILSLLTALSQGKATTSEVYEELKELPFKDLQFARLDSHRALRQGAPEVIYCPGKTVEQIITIARQLKNGHKIVVGTRADEQVAKTVEECMPDSKYYPQAKMLIWGELPESPGDGPRVGIISAGTADGPVVEEAYLYLAASAVATERISDVGVAGLHRLLDVLSVLRRCDVLIVIAGMDGVLPSVVGGLVEAPVIAVPTSVGYGASFEGLSALLTMLNSCAAGLTVVNIDNGFGAAAAAFRVLSAMKAARHASSLPVK